MLFLAPSPNGEKTYLLLFVISGEGQKKNHAGSEVTERVQRVVECRCQCFTKFNEVELREILKSFNVIKDHEIFYLCGCVTVTEAENGAELCK